MIQRCSGVLLHPTSFPSKYGIGDLGPEAYRFIDFLANSRQSLWQILPLETIEDEHSPYKCLSAFAGNPLLISIENLMDEGYLDISEIENLKNTSDDYIDYEKVIELKYQIFRTAFNNFKKMSVNKVEFENFCKQEKEWLDDYVLYISLKNYHNNTCWINWEKEIAEKHPDRVEYYRNILHEEIEFQKFIQYIFFKQWLSLKKYANNKGIKIIGDLSMYVSYDSCDVWQNKELFELDINGYPTVVSGFPPQYPGDKGQLWGHPIYNWDAIKNDKYNWWMKRISMLLRKSDIIRIDHFRGFESYWVIPANESDPSKGYWQKGPGHDFFHSIRKNFGDITIISEDIGLITENVIKLRDDFNLIGTKNLQYSFEYDKSLNPNPQNTIAYTGTHDDDTAIGWYRAKNEIERASINKFLKITGDDIAWDMIKLAWSSVSMFAVAQMQDILSLGTEARMNFQGTVGNSWKWRFTENALTEEICEKLKQVTMLYDR